MVLLAKILSQKEKQKGKCYQKAVSKIAQQKRDARAEGENANFSRE